MNARLLSRAFVLLGLVSAGASCVQPDAASANATITIVNTDGAGEGFNDPTPVAPVGGNPGTTLGQQRLVAFQFAADIWALALDSNVEIRVQATFDPLSCNATSAVLGSAGATFVFANFPGSGNFPGAAYPETWHPSALADKRAGVELNPTPGTADLRARFNVNLGLPGCLTGIGWYYGLDGNHGSQIDLVAVLLHEFGHGLGNQQFANLSTGANLSGRTDVYARNMYDKTAGKTWDAMTNAERAASAINNGKVVWIGPAVTAAAPQVLQLGVPGLTVHSPGSIAGLYAVGAAQFGPSISSTPVTGNVVQAIDGGGASTLDGCEPLTNAAAVAGNIAIIDRGTCAFTIKVKNAQNAGATAVIIADNAPGAPPAGLGGADPTIVIPSARVTQPDGNLIKANLPGVNATLGVNLSVRAGADENDRLLLFAPNPVQGGSSISHWDPIAFPNLLMEPFNTPNQPHSLVPPDDVTLATMRDIGWYADPDLDGIASEIDCEPNSDRSATVVIDGCDTGVPNPLASNGCTLADQLNHIAASARNHGAFVSGVAHYTNNLRRMGTMTDEQRSAIMVCAAHSGVGNGRIVLEDLDAGMARFGLRFAGSNPARRGASLQLTMPARGAAAVRVFDVRGALVRELASQEFAAGSHELRWDGRDASGSVAEPGVYFVHAAARGEATSLRFVLIQ